MAACEKCWADSGGDPDLYVALLRDRTRKYCTAEEQAGPDAKVCDFCQAWTVHQHAGVCMRCGRESEGE